MTKHETIEKVTTLPAVQSRREGADVSPTRLIELALTQGADPSVLERLMDLQERHHANIAKQAYVTAFTQFKSLVSSIMSKDSAVDFTGAKGRVSYKFTSLPFMLDHVVRGLAENGLSVHWDRPEQTKDNITVRCIITHELGHSESGSLSAPPDNSGGKSPVQAVQSTVTSLERYTLAMLLGLAGSNDDADLPDSSPVYTDDAVQGLYDSLLAHCNGNAMELNRFISQATERRANTWEEAKRKRLLEPVSQALSDATPAATAPTPPTTASSAPAAGESKKNASQPSVGPTAESVAPRLSQLYNGVSADMNAFVHSATEGKYGTWMEARGDRDAITRISAALDDVTG